MILYVVIVVLFILFPLYIYLIESRKGGLEISTAQCAYNRAQYGATLNWDEHCFYINGHPLLIISCDFFYWRIPDQSRWESILKKYKSNGFNCVRICFHWGFHSPDEGKYYFERNRDIEYLLRLCEKIKLFVLAAPGPYICSETQAGGYPLWLLDKNLRVRHMDFTGYKKYDERFAAYEREWFEVLLPIIAKHQITTKPDGCVIGMQIENKLIESKCGVPFGLHDEMRFLCKVVRDCGINVPLFNNDSTELGSFIARADEEENFFARTLGKLFGSRKKFGLDLYGFSKYVVLVPPAGKEQSSLMWKPWKPQMFMNGVDGIERKVRGFGGEAARSPIFIPELQGGWSNHYKTSYTFDDMFGYFGDFYTKLLFESVLAQGCTMTSIHTAYGGTNWGTIGDTDAYTSNDYSACIRECGYISSRMRDFRQSILFAKSFSDIFIKTERVRHPTVSSSIEQVVNLQRHSVTTENHGEQVTLTFLRNFSKEKQAAFQINVDYQSSSKMLHKIQLQCFLPYKLSFIALGNYTTLNGLKLVFSTLPIFLRTKLPASEMTPACEIWIVSVNDTGELAFEGDVIVESNMSPSTRNCDKVVNAISFDGSPGYAKIRKSGDDVDNCLYVLALDRSDLGTLHGFFDEPYWGQGQRKTLQEDATATKQEAQVTSEGQQQQQEQEQLQSNISVYAPVYVVWGTQQVYYNSQSKTLEVYYGEEETEVTLISLKPPSNTSVPNASYPLPFVYTIPLTPHHVTSTLDLTPQLRSWQKRVSDLANLNWRPTSLKQSPLEHGLVSGHVLYKTHFPAEYSSLKSKVKLSINVRHRCSIFLNDQFVGGHTVYSNSFRVPGCKNGPELFTSFGKKKYDLTQFLKLPKSEETNVLIIVVENLGINRQMDMFNDVRNPRGLISASFTGLKTGNKPQWSICGVDARRLDCSFITSGIPDEHKRTGWISLPSLPESGVNPSDGLSWWKFSFSHPVSSKLRLELSAPLRLVLYGSFTSYIFLNGTLIGRYYGNGDSPQHDFYLMDGLLKHDEDNTIVLLVYGWETVISSDLKVQVRGWEIDDASKSGNVVRLRQGTEYVESARNGWVVWKANINL